jgi:hypothetical protein
MPKPSILQVITSVLAAFVGIQSGKNREVDFTTGKISHYIVVGLIVVVLFILTIVFIVSKVMGTT